MTVRAAEFYQREAQELGVVPSPVFDGQSKPLVEGRVFSTFAPGAVGQLAAGELKVIIGSTIPFVVAGTDATPVYYDRKVMHSSERNIAAITGRMLLSRNATVKGGQVSNLAIEALAPDELVLPGMLSAFGPAVNSAGLRDPAGRRVFLIVSGLLDASRPCAGIAGVYLNISNHNKRSTPHFLTGALSQAIAKDWYSTHREK